MCFAVTVLIDIIFIVETGVSMATRVISGVETTYCFTMPITHRDISDAHRWTCTEIERARRKEQREIICSRLMLELEFYKEFDLLNWKATHPHDLLRDKRDVYKRQPIYHSPCECTISQIS